MLRMAEQLSMFDIKSPKYAVLDFETGGLDEKVCGLASVGVIRLDENLQEVDRDYFLMYEEDKVYEQGALDVNQLTLEQLRAEGLRPEQFIPRLHELVDGLVMVNHNSSFDCKWLLARGWSIQEAIDTMALSLELYPYQKAKQTIAAQREGIVVTNAHNALADVEVCAELLRKYALKKADALTPKPIVWNRWK